MDDLDQSAIANRNRARVVKLLFGLLLLLLLLVTEQGWQIVRGTSVKSQSWEYAIEAAADAQLQGRLQTLGSAGWELVFARRTTTENDFKTIGIYEMILRRPAGALFATPTPSPAR
jgi:hypothetical protein